MYDTIPDADNKSPEYAYQGIDIKNLEYAVREGWVPVKEKDQEGHNWPLGPTGHRMFREQVLCRMPRTRFAELEQRIQDMQEVLTVDHVEKNFKQQMEQEHGASATGSIKDG